jgi:hypothetical protein
MWHISRRNVRFTVIVLYAVKAAVAAAAAAADFVLAVDHVLCHFHGYICHLLIPCLRFPSKAPFKCHVAQFGIEQKNTNIFVVYDTP